jgi:hypothetical protein
LDIHTTIFIVDRNPSINLSQWFSGKIRACHARAPCSIHGCDISFAFAHGEDLCKDEYGSTMREQ